MARARKEPPGRGGKGLPPAFRAHEGKVRGRGKEERDRGREKEEKSERGRRR